MHQAQDLLVREGMPAEPLEGSARRCEVFLQERRHEGDNRIDQRRLDPRLLGQQRKELATLIASPHATRVAAHALVTDSRPVQMVLKALDWFVKKPYPEQVFVDPSAALDWLQEHVPLDRTGLVSAVLREVPAREREPAFEALTRGRASRRPK